MQKLCNIYKITLIILRLPGVYNPLFKPVVSNFHMGYYKEGLL